MVHLDQVGGLFNGKGEPDDQSFAQHHMILLKICRGLGSSCKLHDLTARFPLPTQPGTLGHQLLTDNEDQTQEHWENHNNIKWVIWSCMQDSDSLVVK